MWLRRVCWPASWAVVLCGCAGTPAARELEFKLQKAERERDGCQRTLADERAKATALTGRLEAEDRKSAAAQAEIINLRGRVDILERVKGELQTALERRASEPLSRPAIPASPLPPEVDEALRTLAGKYAHRVSYERGRGALTFANDQMFEAGSDTVRADAQAVLHELARVLAGSLPESFEVVVVGHTDDTAISREETRAQHPTNWHLSVHRAIAVAQVLVQAGVPGARLGVLGYGPYRPVGDDRARNRRVEVFVVRKGDIQGFEPVRPGRAR